MQATTSVFMSLKVGTTAATVAGDEDDCGRPDVSGKCTTKSPTMSGCSSLTMTSLKLPSSEHQDGDNHNDDASTVCAGSSQTSSDWSDLSSSFDPYSLGSPVSTRRSSLTSLTLLFSEQSHFEDEQEGTPAGDETRKAVARSAKGRVARRYKTQQCKFFARGHCSLGTSCGFAHDPSEQQLEGAAARKPRRRGKKCSLLREEEADMHTTSSTFTFAQLPRSSADRILLYTDKQEEECYYLRVKNCFLDTQVQQTCVSSSRRHRSLPAFR
mmetsp:Transcript_65396/g.156374  ORF Transcript_65396/g.156374 Transcript_65396/m.156374 type:complete len:269 (+) Transcript_65396:73-879(+)